MEPLKDEVKPKHPRLRKRPSKPAVTDDRLLSRNQDLEGLLKREKAVNHQAHTEINRLNRELGKEKAENARLNADLFRIHQERDSLKQKGNKNNKIFIRNPRLGWYPRLEAEHGLDSFGIPTLRLNLRPLG